MPIQTIRPYIGGTFDPIHLGHVQLAKEACDLLQISHIYLLPSHHHPFKGVLTPQKRIERRNALKQTTQKYPFIKTDYQEYTETDKTNYTIDTLKKLRQIYPEDSLFFVMGSDNFNTIIHWKQWENLTDYANLLVFQRPPTSSRLENVEKKTIPNLDQWLQPRLITDNRLTQLILQQRVQKSGTICCCPMKNPIQLSSTEIRQNAEQ